MRRNGLHLFPLISMLLLISASSYGQAWPGVLSSSRAIDWSHAGLPPSYPNGETTANSWTPPASRPICTTVSTISNLTTVLANCAKANPGGSVVNLSAGSYTLSSSSIRFDGVKYVTLRGAGPMQTTISMVGTSGIVIGADVADGSGRVTSTASNYTVGNQSVVVTASSGPAVGVIGWFGQCDTGFTWNGNACTGSPTDNNGLFVCALYSACDLSGGSPSNNRNQIQTVLITASHNNGDGTFTIGFSPGLYMPNWTYNAGTILTWESPSYFASGIGIEDMTIEMDTSQNQSVNFQDSYGSWVKGVRFVGSGVNGSSLGLGSFLAGASKNNLVANNYFYAQTPTALSKSISGNIGISGDTDDLILNNIITGGIAVEGGYSPQADVVAYNYNRDVQTTYYQTPDFLHAGGSSFILREGNQLDISEDDDTWGSHNLNTWVRNYYSCWDAPYVTLNPRALQIDNFARFENVIGNALGGSRCSAGYQGNSSSLGYIFVLPSSDSLALNSMMRWGNCDVINGNCRFVGSEVPTNLGAWPNSVAFQNPVPSDNSLPCSFFISSLSSSPCTFLTSGGTGLSWWKVCINWSSFPNSCSASQTQPFPAAGPEVTGGPYVNGHAYDIPAAVAFQNLPIDTSLQNSYSITSSTWSNGTETLTVSNLPSLLHLMGGFQVTGVAACNSPAGGEFVMTSSTTATVSYALASNPGNCAGGTMKFPDVRQFDERVYQADSGGNTSVNPPTSLNAIVQ